MVWQSGEEYYKSTFFRRLSGSIPSSYTVFYNPDDEKYHAECNVVGGTAVSPNVDFVTIIDSLVANNLIIVCKPDTYEVAPHMGVNLDNKSNIAFIAPMGCIWKKLPESGTTTGQILEVDTCEDITFRGITFDGDCGDRPAEELANPYGNQWLTRVVDGSKNIKFLDCKFLNALQCSSVIANSSHIHHERCIFNNIGEHPVYWATSSHITCRDSQFYNWAKIWRGYIKVVTNSENILFEDCYFEPNEDGLGYPDSDIRGKGATDFGGYGPVIVDTGKKIKFKHCWFLGSGLESLFTEVGGTSHLVTFDDVYVYDFSGLRFTSQDRTHFSEIKNSYFDFNGKGNSIDGFPMLIDNTTFKGGGTGTIANDDVIIKNCRYERSTWNVGAGDYVIVVTGSNVLFDKCKFYDWTSRFFYLPSSVGFKFYSNQISGGVASGFIYLGTNTDIQNNTWENDVTNGIYVLMPNAGTNCTFKGNNIGASLTLAMPTTGMICFTENSGCDDDYQTQTGSWADPSGTVFDGRIVTVYNSTAGQYRIYTYSNGAWRYVALS